MKHTLLNLIFACSLMFAEIHYLAAQTSSAGSSTAGSSGSTAGANVEVETHKETTTDYTKDIISHTQKLKEDLNLTADQEVKVKGINEQRAQRMNDAYSKLQSDSTQWLAEVQNIESWSDSQYKTIFQPGQYQNYVSNKGNYKEFKYKTDNFKIKSEKNELKVKDKENDSKIKEKKDEVKIKEGDTKYKQKKDEIKIKSK